MISGPRRLSVHGLSKSLLVEGKKVVEAFLITKQFAQNSIGRAADRRCYESRGYALSNIIVSEISRPASSCRRDQDMQSLQVWRVSGEKPSGEN